MNFKKKKKKQTFPKLLPSWWWLLAADSDWLLQKTGPGEDAGTRDGSRALLKWPNKQTVPTVWNSEQLQAAQDHLQVNILDPVNLKLGTPGGISRERGGGSLLASFQSMTRTGCRLGRYKMHTTEMNMGREARPHVWDEHLPSWVSRKVNGID